MQAAHSVAFARPFDCTTDRSRSWLPRRKRGAWYSHPLHGCETETTFLFSVSNPKALTGTRSAMPRGLAPACDRIGQPRVSWHSFRHTHATLLTDVGESIKTAQAQLGHSDLATTLNLYAHAIPDSQRRAVERVAEALFSNVLKLDDGAKNG
jgi:integrase